MHGQNNIKSEYGCQVKPVAGSSSLHTLHTSLPSIPVTAREREAIKPVHEEARIQMKCGGSGGKQGGAESAAREKGNAKSVIVLSLTRFKRIKTFRIQATSRLFQNQLLNFSCYLIPNAAL